MIMGISAVGFVQPDANGKGDSPVGTQPMPLGHLANWSWHI